MSAASQTSLDVKHNVEKHDELVDPSATDMPASLQGLSDHEREVIRKAYVRKIDIMIMPSITHTDALTFMELQLNYLDRQNISAAKLAGITKDLKLTAVQYQMCISFLFVGYILFQVPSNMVVGKVSRPAQYICLGMAVWGVVSAATAAVHNFTGLVICRAVLGVCEAVFFPGAIYYLSTFYTGKQMATRTAFLYSGSQLGNAFGGLFAIAILKLEGAHGIEGWRWLFSTLNSYSSLEHWLTYALSVIEGGATVGIAALLVFQLPNSPAMCPWITSQERDSLVYNLSLESGGKDSHAGEISSTQALGLVLRDPKTYLLMGLLYNTYISAAVVSFFPSVVATLGYSRNITYCLTAPPYLLTIVCMMINGWHSDKTQERFYHIACPLVVAIVANVIAVATLHTGARYFAMMLMPTSLYSSAIVTLSLIMGSMTQPAIKRALAIGVINASCNTPNVWTPFLYKAAPHYTVAFSVNCVAAALAIVFAVATRFYLKAKNAEMDAGDFSAKGGPTAEQISHGYRYTI
ncbi:hypothetical protein RQP46_004069 [Phenoliferia psychrophenolica]